MVMEIVFQQKKLPNLLLHKFVDLDIVQTQMGLVFILIIHLHQLFILAQLDSSLMETENAFKR
jgi:hypothetical protein